MGLKTNWRKWWGRRRNWPWRKSKRKKHKKNNKGKKYIKLKSMIKMFLRMLGKRKRIKIKVILGLVWLLKKNSKKWRSRNLKRRQIPKLNKNKTKNKKYQMKLMNKLIFKNKRKLKEFKKKKDKNYWNRKNKKKKKY